VGTGREGKRGIKWEKGRKRRDKKENGREGGREMRPPVEISGYTIACLLTYSLSYSLFTTIFPQKEDSNIRP